MGERRNGTVRHVESPAETFNAARPKVPAGRTPFLHGEGAEACPESRRAGIEGTQGGEGGDDEIYPPVAGPNGRPGFVFDFAVAGGMTNQTRNLPASGGSE